MLILKIDKQKSFKQTGFSLIELLIGLVISLIATLAISTAFSQFETSKRRISAGADAQTNGNLALYSIQRDVQNAGYGLPIYSSTATPLNCPLSTTIMQDGGDPINLSPVIITDGGNASDQIAVRYGNNNVGGAYDELLTTVTINNTNVTNINLTNTTVIQYAVNDVILLQKTDPNNLCSLAKVNALNPNKTIASLKELTTTLPAADRTDNAPEYLADLGAWNEYRFSINANYELTRTGGSPNPNGIKFPNKDPVPLVSDIVALQAQYGVSADLNTNQVTNWVDATGDFSTVAMSLDNRNRIKAVRITVVARDGAMQKTNVSQACDGNAANLAKVCIWNSNANRQNIDLSTIPNWQRFRYKVFETAVPLRSMLWNLCDLNPEANECKADE